MIFNNHPSVSILNMTGIRRSVMHQWTVSWRHVWLVKYQVWPRKEWEFYSSYRGKFWIQSIQRHATNNYLTCLYHRYRHSCFWWQWSPLELYFMMTRLSQICAFLSSIHTNEKLNSVVFSHYYRYHNIEYEQAIALINKKSKTLYRFRRVTAIDFSFDNKCSHPRHQPRPALTTADQVLNSLLFGDLQYFVTGNDKDEPK